VARRLSDPHPGWASRRARSLVCSSGGIVLKTSVAGLPIWEVKASRPLHSKMRLHLRTVQTEQPIDVAISESLCPASTNSTPQHTLLKGGLLSSSLHDVFSSLTQHTSRRHHSASVRFLDVVSHFCKTITWVRFPRAQHIILEGFFASSLTRFPVRAASFQRQQRQSPPEK